MTPLVIFGASGHARVIADAARCSGMFTLVGMLDSRLARGACVDGIEVLGNDAMLAGLISTHPGVQGIVGVGSNTVREQIVRSTVAQHAGFRFAAVFHPAAAIASDVVVGEGSFVAAGAVVNCGSRIGAHAVINTSASVDHDCVIEDFAFVAPQAALAGSVTVGRSAFFGIGACAIPGMKVGARSIVGAGAAVVHDVSPGTIVAGVPARVLPRRNASVTPV